MLLTSGCAIAYGRASCAPSPDPGWSSKICPSLREILMGILLWLLGVPLTLIIVLKLFGVF